MCCAYSSSSITRGVSRGLHSRELNHAAIRKESPSAIAIETQSRLESRLSGWTCESPAFVTPCGPRCASRALVDPETARSSRMCDPLQFDPQPQSQGDPSPPVPQSESGLVRRAVTMPDGSVSPLISWNDLSGGQRDLFIEFEGQLYHLRQTRNGKLILGK